MATVGTLRDFLLDPRGNREQCAFCTYYSPYGPGRYLSHGYGECLVPDEEVKVPISYRAENEGTAAWYGDECPFFIRVRTELPDWDFLNDKARVKYEGDEG